MIKYIQSSLKVIYLICSILIIVLIIYFPLYDIQNILIVLIVMNTITFFLHERVTKNRMKRELENLSDVIQSLVDQEELLKFSLTEDSLMSKIQSQLIKFSRLLTHYHINEKKEKERLTTIIGDISYQLKTPFSNLKIYQEFLLEEDISLQDKIDFQDAVKKQTEKLEWLIESLIKMSRIESECVKLNVKKVNLHQILLETISMIYLKAVKKNINIKLNCIESIKILCDKKWTVEAIYNIVDNAVKYSKDGTTIYIDVVESEMFVGVHIIDEGSGITEGEINQVFKRFYRSKSVQDINGVGIGLFISQEIMTQQGGYIFIKNRKKGSEFIVKFKC